MTRISQIGPAVVVAVTLVAALFAGPSTIRGVVNASTRADITMASARLEDGNVLEAISSAQRDIAIVVEPSVVHVSSQGSVDAGSRFGNSLRPGQAGFGMKRATWSPTPTSSRPRIASKFNSMTGKSVRGRSSGLTFEVISPS